MRFKQAVLTCLLLSTTPFAYAHQPRQQFADLQAPCMAALLENPFYTYVSGPFPYDQLKTEHFEPAFNEALWLSKKRLDAIRKNPEQPLFENTIEALEFASEPINRVGQILFAIAEMNATKELRQVLVKVTAQYESFFTDITLDPVLRARVQAVVDRGARNRLTEEEKTLLKNTAKAFITVPEDKIGRLKTIDAELTRLGDKFKGNITGETETYELVFTDPSELKGLPPSNLEAAATAATERGHAGSWVITLDGPSLTPALAFIESRELREKLWRAFSTMGTREPYDNRETILEMIKLRQERAEMLGFKNHAEFMLKYRMAKNVETVNKFLDGLADAYRPKAQAEVAELEQFAGHKIEPWDTAYYLQKLKQQKFGFNPNDLKPYFVFDNVLKGAFYAAKRKYGVDFVPRNIPTWHKSVRAFEVFDRLGQSLGYYYFDPFPRDGKRGGAWSTELIAGGLLDGKPARPHIVNVGNLTPPSAEGELALLTFNDVRTVFHEMGHALHNLLSKARYRSLFGNNVAWDFVELPSQLFEKWAMNSEVLDVYARHYKTKERIPEALIQKVKDSRNFGNAGFGLNQVFKSRLDIDWHSVPVNGRSVEQFEADVRKNYSILPAQGALTSTGFNHIFPNSYSAGYYSYQWADVSVSDAFEMFEENGMFDPQTTYLYHSQIMERGGTEDADVLYPRFRGRAPDSNAFLRDQGLIEAPQHQEGPQQLELLPKPKSPEQLELFQ